jgi:2-polyprenyl-3-methyl-5-hydroxy-6-metoxy-1,4-benzoquinol methylase
MEKRLQNEVKHGRFLAQHDPGQTWNWAGVAGRRRWSRRVEMLMSDLRPDMKVLEIGCGSGFFTRELANSRASVTAIDISPDLLDLAKSNLTNSNVTFIVENAYDMSFEDNSFDAVVGISVLHHLDIDKGLSEIFRVLKPGGFMLFTEPNMMNPQIALQKNIPALKKFLGDSPDETAFFRWGIRSRMLHYGFRSVKVFPFDFLHPGLPARLVPLIEGFCISLEKIPFIREIAGSIFIRANKEP